MSLLAKETLLMFCPNISDMPPMIMYSVPMPNGSIFEVVISSADMTNIICKRNEKKIPSSHIERVHEDYNISLGCLTVIDALLVWWQIFVCLF